MDFGAKSPGDSTADDPALTPDRLRIGEDLRAERQAIGIAIPHRLAGAAGIDLGIADQQGAVARRPLIVPADDRRAAFPGERARQLLARRGQGLLRLGRAVERAE